VPLISLISAARVVDLPEPVAPVTSTSPRSRLANRDTRSGMPSSCRLGPGVDHAQHHGDRTALVERVAAHPADVLEAIDRSAWWDLSNSACRRADIIVRASRSMKSAGSGGFPARAQDPVHAQDRVVAGAQMDVRGPVAHGHGQDLAEQLEGSLVSTAAAARWSGWYRSWPK